MKSKAIITFLLVLLIMIVTVVPGSEGSFYQRSWYGGPGFPGPVTDWGEEFDISEGVTWRSSYYLYLGPPFKYNVDDELGAYSSCYGADIDGDLDIDVVGKDSVGVFWWENIDGDGENWVKQVIDSEFLGGVIEYASDIDGDGDVDVFGTSNSDYHEVCWWENSNSDGSVWQMHLISDEYSIPVSLYVEDIDGDDYNDVIVAYYLYYPDGKVIWWENIYGDGTSWTEHQIGGPLDAPGDAFPVDLDNDNDIDVVAAIHESHTIRWWENVGGSGDTWVSHIIDDAVSYPVRVTATDLDNDSDIDVTGTSMSDSTVSWWENLNGFGTLWMEHIVDDSVNDPIISSPGDFDNDGDIDLAVGAVSFGSNLNWYENLDGYGNSWHKYEIGIGCDAVHSLWSIDVDSDGLLSILTSEFFLGEPDDWDEIAWWELTGPTPPEGTLTSSVLDAGEDPPAWTDLDWSSETPLGTSITFWVRSSPDYNDMGEWSDEITEPCDLSEYFDEEDRYIQYKVKLETDYEDVTPVLEWVRFNGYFTGIRLNSFYCKGAPGNAISITWSVEATEGESIAGFNLYRREMAAVETRKVTGTGGSANKVSGEWTKVNAALITGENPYVYIDASVEPGVTYEYKLEAVVDGRAETLGTTTGTAGAQPAAFALYQSRPNPARGEAVISFELPENTEVTLSVYDLSGRKVATMADGLLPAGEHERAVSGLAPGVYVYRLDAGGFVAAQKMVVIE
jgi:hypothetical protein